MAKALIGYTGFVGGNLAAQIEFDDFYNSTNISEIAGRKYDLVVCAGAPAEKWKANQDPQGDSAALERLKDPLKTVQATKVVLISTVDVYPTPVDVDESTPIDPLAVAPYGRHRLELERFVAQRYDSLVVRLPALFGPGLKKNAIFDLLHQNMVEQIHADSVFQFYPVIQLASDLDRFLASKIALINAATEPLSMREVAAGAFGMQFDNRPSRPPARYDFRTVYAERFGGSAGYLLRRRQVLDALKAFVRAERSRTQ